MKEIHLGLFQESQNRFAVALHADASPFALQEFWIDDGSVRFGENGMPVLDLADAGNSDLRAMIQFTLHKLQEAGAESIDAFLMSLNTSSDWVQMTVIPNGTAASRALTAMMGFAPIPCIRFDEELIVYVRHALPPESRGLSLWHIVHPALLLQCAEIFYPGSPTAADSCASLAARPELLDYLTALGETFSITDIEQTAAAGQTEPTSVIAGATDIFGSNGYQLYRLSLSERAIANAALLNVSYLRARAQHAKGLLERTRNRTGMSAGDEYRANQVDHLSHHLAILHVCAEFGIDLSVEPFKADSEE